ncbi:unnamed protein product [Staurois parvus]|nr:unnamed protein product [Staurois parvus]
MEASGGIGREGWRTLSGGQWRGGAERVEETEGGGEEETEGGGEEETEGAR